MFRYVKIYLYTMYFSCIISQKCILKLEVLHVRYFSNDGVGLLLVICPNAKRKSNYSLIL